MRHWRPAETFSGTETVSVKSSGQTLIQAASTRLQGCMQATKSAHCATKQWSQCCAYNFDGDLSYKTHSQTFDHWNFLHSAHSPSQTRQWLRECPCSDVGKDPAIFCLSSALTQISGPCYCEEAGVHLKWAMWPVLEMKFKVHQRPNVNSWCTNT